MEIGARRLSVKPGSLVAFSNTPPGSERGSSKASKLKKNPWNVKMRYQSPWFKLFFSLIFTFQGFFFCFVFGFCQFGFFSTFLLTRCSTSPHNQSQKSETLRCISSLGHLHSHERCKKVKRGTGAHNQWQEPDQELQNGNCSELCGSLTTNLLHLALSSGVLQQHMMCLPLAGICVALTGLCLLTDSLGHTKD